MLISKNSRRKSEQFESRFRDGLGGDFPLRQYLRCREDFTSGLIHLIVLGAFAFTLVMYTLCATTFTVFQVPYIAMPAEMTGDYHETTRLMAYRMAFMTAGILIAGAGAPMPSMPS